jgi:ubiquinone/menaquinone biosynthesis C-methylase UbiE
LSRLLSAVPGVDYLSADLDPDKAMIGLDITDIDFPANTFDVIYCSHVLEHVPEDTAGMTEIARVLTASGWAILQVPIIDGPTREDPSLTDPADRERLFGQHDHVRYYGNDGVYEQRLRDSGFDVTVDDFASLMTESEAARYGVVRTELVFRAERAYP